MRVLASWLDRYSWLWLIFAAPFLLFPSPTRSLALLVLPLIWIAGGISTGTPFPRTILNPSLLLMASMVLVSLWATYDLNISLGKVCGVMLGMAVCFMFIQKGTTRRGWLVCMGIFGLCGLGIAGASLLGTNWVIGSKWSFLTNITSKLPVSLTQVTGAAEGFHPNEVAGALLWALPLMITTTIGLARKLYFQSKRRDDNYGYRSKIWIAFIMVGIACLFSLLILVLTQSRTAYLALILTLIILGWVILPRRWQIGLAVLAVIGVAIFGFYVNSMGADTLDRFLFESNAGDASNSINTIEGRLEIWRRAYECVRDFPYTGMGMNTFRTVVYVVHPPLLFSPSIDIGHAHNEFLQAALDLGVPGLLAFIGLYVAAFILIYKGYHLASQVDPDALPWILGLAGGLIAHGLFGLNDAVALGAKPGILYWMLLGLSAGLPNWLRKSTE